MHKRMKAPEIPAWVTVYIKGKVSTQEVFDPGSCTSVSAHTHFQNPVKNTASNLCLFGGRMKNATMLAPRLSSKVVA